MESRAKIAGHAAHPMFIVFPLALFTMAVVLDIVFFVTGNPVFANAARAASTSFASMRHTLVDFRPCANAGARPAPYDHSMLPRRISSATVK